MFIMFFSLDDAILSKKSKSKSEKKKFFIQLLNKLIHYFHSDLSLLITKNKSKNFALKIQFSFFYFGFHTKNNQI